MHSKQNSRIENKLDAYYFGDYLYLNTQKDLALLKSILGVNNLQYKLLSDNVAKEILQCSIDYFNESQEQNSSSDYLKEALNLARMALKIARNESTLNRIKDNIQILKNIKEYYHESLSETSSELPFKIINAEITNTDGNGVSLVTSDPIAKKHARYIGITLKIKGLKNKIVDLKLKYIKPDGRAIYITEGDSKGYIIEVTKQIFTGQLQSLIFGGFGASDKCIFESGTHRIDVYVNGHRIYSKNFSIDYISPKKNTKRIQQPPKKKTLKEQPKREYSKNNNLIPEGYFHGAISMIIALILVALLTTTCS